MKNKTIKNLFVFFLIILVLLPAVLISVPRQTMAQTEAVSVPTSDAKEQSISWLSKILKGKDLGVHVKEWAQKTLELAKMAIAKRVLEQVTQSTINWINSGFHGAPLFLENPDSFFKDILKSEVKTFVNMFGYDSTRYPFGKNFALNAINSYKSTLQRNAAHTMSRVMNQQQISALGNFPQGGWNGFFFTTQYPQNNYIGFQIMASNGLAKHIAGTIQAPAQKIQKQLSDGMGFLSPQRCMDNDGNNAYNNNVNPWQTPSYQCNPPACDWDVSFEECTRQQQTACAQQKADYDSQYSCKNLVNTTPGSVVANQIMTSMTSGTRQSELQMALGQSLSAIFDALINKFLGDGLTALADSMNDNPPADNWTYDGQSLDGGAGDTTGPGPLNIPQNVSLSVGETTSIEITGGKPAYEIKPNSGPDSSVATAEINGATLTVTGISPNTTSFVVRDSREGEPRKVTVTVTVVNEGDLMVVPANVTIGITSPFSATVSGGIEPYVVSANPNEAIASAVLSDTILIVTGIEIGETSLVIRDSSPTPKTVTVGINIVASTTDLLGTCTTGDGDVMRNVPESDCATLQGTWVANNNQVGDASVELTANKNTIQKGQSVVVSWESVNTTSCSSIYWADNSSAVSGSKTKSPNVTTTYSATCYGSNGSSATDSVTVEVIDRNNF